MSKRIEELDWRQTRMGELTLRRRIDPVLKREVHEVLLGEEYLMSSSFTVAEIELARLGLSAVPGEGLDVVVGGLGLGYTARAALEDQRVRRLWVVEALDAVIDWQVTGLLPHAAELTDDPRCELVLGDFFALVADGTPFADEQLLDAILLDIDHTPEHVLHPSHAAFYSQAGLQRVHDRLRPGGVFALWSDAPPDDDFLARLRAVFATAEGHLVTFPNPLIDGESSNSVYVASTRDPIN
jgi:spermidine synthase